MNHRILFTLIAASTSAMAARPTATAPAAATAAAVNPLASVPDMKVEPYQLQNRSTFNLALETRTPMWPIGWVRPKGDLPVATPFAPTGTGFLLQPHHVNVMSILLLGNEPLATINGKAFAEGDVLPIYVGEKPIKVTVKAIRDGAVVLEQAGRQIICPIQRKIVPEKANVDPQSTSPDFRIKIQDR